MLAEKTCWLDAHEREPATGSGYPAPFAERGGPRQARLGDALDLTQFGVNLVTLPPGAWSSQRHWHAKRTSSSTCSRARRRCDGRRRDAAQAGHGRRFPAGRADGHHLINRTDRPVVYLEVGTRAETEVAHYSDIDMAARKEGGRFAFSHKNGDPP